MDLLYVENDFVIFNYQCISPRIDYLTTDTTIRCVQTPAAQNCTKLQQVVCCNNIATNSMLYGKYPYNTEACYHIVAIFVILLKLLERCNITGMICAVQSISLKPNNNCKELLSLPLWRGSRTKLRRCTEPRCWSTNRDQSIDIDSNKKKALRSSLSIHFSEILCPSEKNNEEEFLFLLYI